MQVPTTMPESCSDHGLQANCRAVHQRVCDSWVIVGLVALLRANEALAGGDASVAVVSTSDDSAWHQRSHPAVTSPSIAQRPPSGAMAPAASISGSASGVPIVARSPFAPVASFPSLPESFQTESMTLPDRATFPEEDFRAHGPSLMNRLPADALDDAPMLHGTTMWQRLAEFRSHGRVRLLTLWETGTGSVSLQAGRRGDPSLQWTSRFMNRGGPTRGLFDDLVSASWGGGGRSLRFSSPVASAPSAPPVAKPANVRPVGAAAK